MTSAIFPLPINGQWSDSEDKFTLDTPFIYLDTEKDIQVVVEAGFTTDANSVPQLLQSYFPAWQYLKAGLIHDWLYRAPGAYSRPSGAPAQHLTRGQVDSLHGRILELEGMRWSKRQAIRLALLVGGGVAWNRHRAEDMPTL